MSSLSSKRRRRKKATTCWMLCWAAMTTTHLRASRPLSRPRLLSTVLTPQRLLPAPASGLPPSQRCIAPLTINSNLGCQPLFLNTCMRLTQPTESGHQGCGCRAGCRGDDSAPVFPAPLGGLRAGDRAVRVPGGSGGRGGSAGRRPPDRFPAAPQPRRPGSRPRQRCPDAGVLGRARFPASRQHSLANLSTIINVRVWSCSRAVLQASHSHSSMSRHGTRTQRHDVICNRASST